MKLGVIYEAVFMGATQVGSIAGRYDNLVGSIVPVKKVPTVGFSLGIESLHDHGAATEGRKEPVNQEVHATKTEVVLSILGKDLVLAAELLSELWSAGIKAQFKLTPRVQDHIRLAKQSGIPWIVLVEESEMRDRMVKLKGIRACLEEEVPRKDFIQVLKQRLINLKKS